MRWVWITRRRAEVALWLALVFLAGFLLGLAVGVP